MVTFALVWGLLFGTTCFAQMYSVTDLGTLPGGNESYGIGINKLKQVSGYSSDAGGVLHAVIFTDGNVQDLGAAPSASGGNYCSGINDSGQVVGVLGNFPNTNAFLYSNGTVQDLGPSTGSSNSVACGINNSGQVVGWHDYFHVFLYTNGVMQDLYGPANDLGSYDYFGYAINTSGQFVGWGTFPGYLAQQERHAFRYTNGVWQDLGVLPGDRTSSALGINDAGNVVGYSQNFVDFYSRGFLYRNGVLEALPLAPGRLSALAWGINNKEQVVGADGGAVLWSNGNVQDLNALIPPDSGMYLLAARAINDYGQITGYGFVTTPAGTQTHAFLLTPITPYKAFIQEPINADGKSVFKGNRGVVPVKFSLTEDDTPTCALPPATISVTRTAGGVIGSVDEGTYSMTADNGSSFRVDSTACAYVYNLAASAMGAGIYRVSILIDGNLVGNAVFTLK